MRHNSVTCTEIDSMFADRGEVGCDNMYSAHDEPVGWKAMQRAETLIAMDRRAYIDAQREIGNEC